MASKTETELLNEIKTLKIRLDEERKKQVDVECK
jgi:hypothetical protein